MAKRYPQEFRDDVVRVARQRDEGGDPRTNRTRFRYPSNDVVGLVAPSERGRHGHVALGAVG